MLAEEEGGVGRLVDACREEGGEGEPESDGDEAEEGAEDGHVDEHVVDHNNEDCVQSRRGSVVTRRK